MSARMRPGRSQYPVFYPLMTRWADNDRYGHINNVVYYALFDSTVNRFLIEQGGLDIHSGEVIGYVVSSNCHYHAPSAYPEALEAGLCVEHLGGSSVRYGLGIFRVGEPLALAHGSLVHVFVDRHSERPTLPPARLRDSLTRLLTAGEAV